MTFKNLSCLLSLLHENKNGISKAEKKQQLYIFLHDRFLDEFMGKSYLIRLNSLNIEAKFSDNSLAILCHCAKDV